MRLLVLVACGLAGALAPLACGLDLAGNMPDALVRTPDAGAPVDASLPPPSGVEVDACTERSCGLTVPAGWSLVSLTDGATACPVGFVSKDVLESPVAPGAACGCTCQVTASPSCTANVGVGAKYDQVATATCTSTSGALVLVPDGTCRTTSGTPGSHGLIPSPAPVGAAACSATPVPDKAQVTTTTARICVAPSCADACASGALKTCLIAAGDQACPAGVPDKHLVGTGVDLACPACSCAATGPSTCPGTWTIYTDNACGSALNTLPADTCVATTSTTIHSYKWVPNTVNTTCTPTPSAGTATLSGVSTVCCK